MKKIILASVGLLVLAAVQPALAADLPTKAPLVVPFYWTGFYIGGNVGYSWGKWDNSGLASTSSPNVKGWLGGLQAGYNWQVDSRWLVGLEGDIQITGEKASENTGGSTTDVAGTGNFIGFHTITTTTYSNEWKFPWFGTFRGRIGALPEPSMLIYGTGGLAVGHFKMSSQSTSVAQQYRGIVGTTTNPVGGATTTVGTAFSDSTTRWGWTLGAGVEKAFGRNWSAKIEYLYLDLGTYTFLSGTGLDTDVKLRDHIVRAGINYRFGN